MAYTAIDDPSAYFKVQLYTGNGSANHAITFDDTDTDMQPDFVWIKNRDAADGHCLFDALRGATKLLDTQGNAVETTDTDTLDSFTSDGFQVDADVKVNTNTEAYVAWCWKANGTGSSNTNGTINTTATSANTTAGFSINTYVGNATADQTVGHGLGAVPHMIISKNRSNSSTHYNDWIVYHHTNATANDKKLLLNTTGAVASTNEWGDTDPTSTVYSVHTSGDGATNDGTDTHLSYVWTSVQGFSKFGSYVGDGVSGNGPFIYTGFRPAFIIYKNTASAYRWGMYDTKRDPHNLVDNLLYPDINNAENAGDARTLDILSNGFKIRATGDILDINESGEKIIYMAFAEAPFVNSNGVPCNAR